jgi:NACalpha-BTF3-like transcription factor
MPKDRMLERIKKQLILCRIMSNLVRIGSETAKGGFANEKDIAAKFNAWKTDRESQKWLKLMGYDLEEIEDVQAIILHGYKTDVQVKVIVTLKKAISVQNISVKKANDDADYNQVDKRWVDDYKEMWNIPNGLVMLLKMFTGEIMPSEMLKDEKITKQKYGSLLTNLK